LNSTFELIENVDDQIQTFSNSTEKKKDLHEDLTEEFKKLRTEIERNIFVNYPLSLTHVKPLKIVFS